MSAPEPREGQPGVRVTSVAGTPSTSRPVATADTLESLEFLAALAAVAARAVSEPGRASVLSRRPGREHAGIVDALATVAELAERVRAGDPFRPEPIEDVRPLLDAVTPPGAVLDGAGLVAVSRTLTAVRVVAEHLSRVQDEAPLTARLLVPIPPPALERQLADTFDADGAIPDGADRNVDRARGQVRDTRTRLHQLLDRTLRGLDAHERPADGTVTVRGGRYVIPIARDARGRVPGIVHDESSSGATLFVEPHAAVDLGNTLRGAEAEEARAVHAVLRDFSERVRAHLSPIRGGWEMCVRADDLYARARYAVDVHGFAPRIVPSPGPWSAKDVRHPLLLAEGTAPVPFDLYLDEDERTVIVSGPNTGGKTVLLKAIGVTSALVQAGVVPPIGDGSAVPVFDDIVADIGDHQSIEASLSTFSAHVVALRAALERAGPDVLVLLDEVGSGTDPREGAALAGATLLALVEAGARTVATTHLTELKDLATNTPGIVNASLEFDGETLAPTYRLLKGIPGRSYGLVIARRLGVPDAVLREAEARLPDEERALDALLADVEARAARLRELEHEIAARVAAADRDATRNAEAAAELDDRARLVASREKELEREGRAQARKFLLEARRRVEDALAVARAAVSEATAKEARRLVEEGISREGSELQRLEDELRKKGWTVRGRRATDGIEVEAAPLPPRPPPAPDRGVSVTLDAVSDVDLRGLRAHEAREIVIRAIDAAIVADLPSLRIIHGKGTGRLRVLVTALLDEDARVVGHRVAPPQEGGTGVTIVDLTS